jgi:outer membrane protein OmpA-like peptidoglycan-associated protein
MRIGSTAPPVLAVVSLLACQTNTGTVVDKKATQGAILGGLAGAAAGAAIGGHDHRGGGALIGAATGAIAGGMVGHYLDKQAQELDAIPGATVQRRDDSLLVNFESEILFDSGSATLFPGSFDQLRALAQTLNRYPKSDVIIKGHTDSVGEEAFNQTLSERRADGVRNFLIAEAVAPPRITAIGFGESVPVASNDTAVGRQRNRRVEIEIRPYDEVLRGEQTQ